MNSQKEKREPRAGLWSTVHAAVQGGWPHTLRLLSVIAVLGLMAGIGAELGGASELVRAIVPGP